MAARGSKLRPPRRGLLAVLAIASLCSSGTALGASGNSGARLDVRPAVGWQRTSFVVSFTAQRTGFVPSVYSGYEVVASTHGSRGCVSAAVISIPATWQGQRVHTTLKPGRGSRWCKGSYAGRLDEIIRPTCGFREMCPMASRDSPLFIGYLTLSQFSFRVR
jgi:hypothetical protein